MVEVRVDDEAPEDRAAPLDCAATGTVVDPEEEATIAGPVAATLVATSDAAAVAVAVTTATPLFPEAVKVTTLPSGVVDPAAAGATAREDVTVNVNTAPPASVVVEVATGSTTIGEEVVVGEAGAKDELKRTGTNRKM